MSHHATHNDLPAPVREQVVQLLRNRLADLSDLQLQARQAHWNVKGPTFLQLHELFGKIASGLDEHIDEVAERIVQLGGTAHGTAESVARSSGLPKYPPDIVAGVDHLEAMLRSVAVAAKAVRCDISNADQRGDAATADLLTGISRDLDKWLWFIEAHLQSER